MGWGSLGKQLLKTNQNVTARCDDGECLQVSIAKHPKNGNPTFCLSIGLFLNIETLERGSRTVVQAWGGEPVAPGTGHEKNLLD